MKDVGQKNIISSGYLRIIGGILIVVLAFIFISYFSSTTRAATVTKVIDRQLPVVTDNTNAWIEAASVTLTQDGSWLVLTSFDFGIDTNAANGYVQLQQDDTTELQYARFEDPNLGASYKTWFWMTRVERSGSDVLLDLDFKSPSGSITARIRNAIILAIRLDDLGTEDTDWRWNEDNNLHENLGTDWTAENNIIVTETWTPSSEEDWLVIANMELTPNSISRNGEGRLSLNDETSTYDTTNEEGEDILEWLWWSSLRLLTLPASEQKFEIQARSNDSTGADARRGRFFAIRTAVFDQVAEFREDNYTAPSVINTWEEKLNVSFTPNQTEDVWILGHAGIDFNVASSKGRTRVHEAETDAVMNHDNNTSDATNLAPVAYSDVLNWAAVSNNADLDINASNIATTFGDATVIFVSLTLLTPPAITSLDPTSGEIGSSVTITGTNLGSTQGASTVMFNGTAVETYTSWSDTEVVVEVPTDATTGDVVVTVGGTNSNGSAFTVTASSSSGGQGPRPVIDSISPTHIAINSPLTITINGSDFDEYIYASLFRSFSGWIIMDTISVTETQIVVSLPANRFLDIGTYDVVATNPGGSQSIPEHTLTVVAADEEIVDEDIDEAEIDIDEDADEEEGVDEEIVDEDIDIDEEAVDEDITEAELALVQLLREEIGYLEQGISYFANFFRNIFARPSNQQLLQNSYSYSTETDVIDVTVKSEELIYVTIPVKNTGTATWYQKQLYPIRLGTINPANRSSIFATDEWSNSQNRVPISQETIVAPGDTATFVVPLQAPNAPGFYPEMFQLVAEQLLWIPGPKISIHITVE